LVYKGDKHHEDSVFYFSLAPSTIDSIRASQHNSIIGIFPIKLEEELFWNGYVLSSCNPGAHISPITFPYVTPGPLTITNTCSLGVLWISLVIL
jgi:hypothetical protein